MIAVLDFDGTITVKDVSDALFAEFADFERLTSALIGGRLTVAQYYSAAFASMGAACSPDRLAIWLRSIAVDPGFTGLVRWLRSKGIPLRIVSDGFDIYIQPILASVGLADIPVYSNIAVWRNHQFVPEFPGATDSCSCFCASCKRNAVLRSVPEQEVIVYVGDGRSDTCAVEHADIVFAKGYLAAYCNEKRIPHHPYKSLADVQRILSSLLSRKAVRNRRQALLARREAYILE